MQKRHGEREIAENPSEGGDEEDVQGTMAYHSHNHYWGGHLDASHRVGHVPSDREKENDVDTQKES